jgi:hypothetical protein
MDELRTEERLERIEDEPEDLNIRLDAVIEAVRLLAPTQYTAPWSEIALVPRYTGLDTRKRSVEARGLLSHATSGKPPSRPDFSAW